MTKAEYMELLQKRLERFSSELQEEILEDYRQHFAEGEAEGKSEEELIAELGDIEDMICELPEDRHIGAGNEKVLEMQGNMPAVTGNGGNSNGENDNIRIGNDGNSNSGNGNSTGWGPNGNNGANGDWEREKSFVYEGAYETVVLDGKVASMLVEESPDDKIYVEYKDNSEAQRHVYYQYEENGTFYAGFKRIESTLEVNEGRRGFIERILNAIDNMQYESGVRQEITFKVKLPKGLNTIHVKSSSGKVEAKGLVTKLLKVEGGSGRLFMERVQAEEVKCGNGSGRISLHEVVALNVKCGTGSGRIEGDGVKVEMLKCGTGSGSIHMSAIAKVIKMDTGSGRIEVNCAGAVEEAAFSTGSGSVRVDMDDLTGLEAKLSTGSGRSHVNWKGTDTNCRNKTCTFGDGSCKLRASTGSGSIEVIVK